MESKSGDKGKKSLGCRHQIILTVRHAYEHDLPSEPIALHLVAFAAAHAEIRGIHEAVPGTFFEKPFVQRCSVDARKDTWGRLGRKNLKNRCLGSVRGFGSAFSGCNLGCISYE